MIGNCWGLSPAGVSLVMADKAGRPIPSEQGSAGGPCLTLAGGTVTPNDQQCWAVIEGTQRGDPSQPFYSTRACFTSNWLIQFNKFGLRSGYLNSGLLIWPGFGMPRMDNLEISAGFTTFRKMSRIYFLLRHCPTVLHNSWWLWARNGSYH